MRGPVRTLDGQLAAIAAAARATGAQVWVMAPMVSTAAEAEEFAARARSHAWPWSWPGCGPADIGQQA